MAILPDDGTPADVSVEVLIAGAGACGLVAALSAADAGAEVLVLERDAVPQGSTALSSGMIPACGTRAQAAANVEDSAALMAGDLLAKAKGQNDKALVEAISAVSGPTIDWLTHDKGLELTLVEGFLYPGHSAARMHAPPSRSGADLIGGLASASERAGIDIVTDALLTDLIADGDRVTGVRFTRPDGGTETVGCKALILATSGFGGNSGMVRDLIPELAEATYFGHSGNRGDALLWGRDLGAATADLGSYQGHGSVAHPHAILISWALMMEGGIQVNTEGRRFSNEHDGYSEQARRVLAQPGGIAWDIYDARLHELGMGFEDYRRAIAAGAVLEAADASELAALCDLPEAALAETLADIDRFTADAADPFGRVFAPETRLQPPYFAVRVTGSLFHTQGGLAVDGNARVLKQDGTPMPNLYAGGGAARGLSGPSDWGYLSGNGLLAAVMLGRLAGLDAARLVSEG